MKCPHCLHAFFCDWINWVDPKEPDRVMADKVVYFSFKTTICPTCNQMICVMGKRIRNETRLTEIIVYPKTTARPVPPEVDLVFANDFREACLVIGDSEKASAALSRRCLQKLLMIPIAARREPHPPRCPPARRLHGRKPSCVCPALYVRSMPPPEPIDKPCQSSIDRYPAAPRREPCRVSERTRRQRAPVHRGVRQLCRERPSHTRHASWTGFHAARPDRPAGPGPAPIAANAGASHPGSSTRRTGSASYQAHTAAHTAAPPPP